MNNFGIPYESISLLIAVPETSYFKDFVTHIISKYTIQTLGFAEKATDIISMAFELEANVIIVDINLLEGNLNGFITELKKNKYNDTVIIIVDAYDDSINYIVYEFDNIFFIKRPETVESLADQILLVSEHNVNDTIFSNADSIKEDTEFDFPKEYYRQATKLLLNLGFNSKHKGFIYIREAALLKCLIREVGSLSKSVYPFISKKYNVSVESVERAIRSAVDYVWNNSRLKAIGFYDIDYIYSEKPSNAIIINHISDIIKSGETLKRY